jgi:hypothetical protein
MKCAYGAAVRCDRSNVIADHGFIGFSASRQLLPYSRISNGGAISSDFVPAQGQSE